MQAQEMQSVIDVVKHNLSPFVEAAKNTAGIGWEIMLKKVFLVDGVLTVSASAVLIASSAYLFAVGIRAQKKYRDACEEQGTNYPSRVGYEDVMRGIAPATASILAIIAFVAAVEGTPRVVLPEYYAIIEIIKLAQ